MHASPSQHSKSAANHLNRKRHLGDVRLMFHVEILRVTPPRKAKTTLVARRQGSTEQPREKRRDTTNHSFAANRYCNPAGVRGLVEEVAPYRTTGVKSPKGTRQGGGGGTSKEGRGQFPTFCNSKTTHLSFQTRLHKAASLRRYTTF